MKYIRTKDGIVNSGFSKKEYEKKYPSSQINYDEWFDLVKLNYEFISTADTIEELIDEWVYVKNHEETPALVYWLSTNKKHKDDDVYGAIWTDKGLIFVAKMNDKGELELL